MEVFATMWKTYTEHNDPDFGTKKCEEFTIEDAKAICKFALSTDNPLMHNLWLLHCIQFALGIQLGLQGQEEHHDLWLHNVSFGTHGALDGVLVGKECIKFKGEILSKTNRMAIGACLGTGQ